MQRKGVRAVPRRATRQRVRTVTCVTVGTNVTLCVRTCACVGDRPAARPWPPPAVPPLVCPNAGAHTGTWHGSTSRASSAAFGPARNQPNASPGDHPGTRRCPLTDRSTCDGAFKSRLLSQGKTRGLDGDHQGAGPFDQAVTARPSSVGRPSNCRQMHVPPAVRSSVSCPEIAGHCVFFSDGGVTNGEPSPQPSTRIRSPLSGSAVGPPGCTATGGGSFTWSKTDKPPWWIPRRQP